MEKLLRYETGRESRNCPIKSDYLFSTLEKNNLSPQVEADKETLLRRVSFDITGLPPTIEEIDDFINDNTDRCSGYVDCCFCFCSYCEEWAI